MKYPYMPIFWGDFLANTMHLSAHDAGAYLFLIAHLWEHGGEVHTDQNRLRRIARVNPWHWNRTWDALKPMFNITTVGTLLCVSHSRVLQELHTAAELSNKRKAAAQQMLSKRSANAKTLLMHPSSSSLRDSTALAQTQSAPAEQASKRAPASALPSGAPAPSERKEPAADQQHSTEWHMRQKQHLGISPDQGTEYRSPPRPRPEHAHALEPIPDRLVKRPSGEEQDFAPGTLPQCGQCSCPASPSGEPRCWRRILQNSTMAKIEDKSALNYSQTENYDG